MIHYINGKPSKNVRLTKAPRHAVAHYRHTQRMTTLKQSAFLVAIPVTLAVTYLVATS